MPIMEVAEKQCIVSLKILPVSNTEPSDLQSKALTTRPLSHHTVSFMGIKDTITFLYIELYTYFDR